MKIYVTHHSAYQYWQSPQAHTRRENAWRPAIPVTSANLRDIDFEELSAYGIYDLPSISP